MGAVTVTPLCEGSHDGCPVSSFCNRSNKNNADHIIEIRSYAYVTMYYLILASFSFRGCSKQVCNMHGSAIQCVCISIYLDSLPHLKLFATLWIVIHKAKHGFWTFERALEHSEHEDILTYKHCSSKACNSLGLKGCPMRHEYVKRKLQTVWLRIY